MNPIRGLHVATVVTAAEVLQALAEGPATAEAIGQRIGVFPPAVANSIARAAAKGLIARVDLVKHGRTWKGIYALTEAGRDRLSALPDLKATVEEPAASPR